MSNDNRDLHYSVLLYSKTNKKAQLTLTNPRDAEACKIAPIRRVSFNFTEFHFSKFQIIGAQRHATGSRPIWLYIV